MLFFIVLSLFSILEYTQAFPILDINSQLNDMIRSLCLISSLNLNDND